MVDLGFLKGGFCSAEEWKLSYAQPEVESKKNFKKVSNSYTLFFSSLPTMLSFLSHTLFFFMKTTVIEYIDVTVLLKSLDLTALLEYLI